VGCVGGCEVGGEGGGVGEGEGEEGGDVGVCGGVGYCEVYCCCGECRSAAVGFCGCMFGGRGFEREGTDGGMILHLVREDPMLSIRGRSFLRYLGEGMSAQPDGIGRCDLTSDLIGEYRVEDLSLLDLLLAAHLSISSVDSIEPVHRECRAVDYQNP